MQKIANMLIRRMQRHSEMQEMLWKSYEDMGNMILPDENIDIYTGIQSKIKDILKGDLEDPVVDTATSQHLENLLRPLATIFAQIDELNFKCRKLLNDGVFYKFERFIKELVEVDKNPDQATLALKRKRVCDVFCDLHLKAISQLQLLSDSKFKELIFERSKDFIQIKNLYLDVIKYEQKKDGAKKGNLLA